jgi:hypothetical protein
MQRSLFSKRNPEVNGAIEEAVARVDRGADPGWKFHALEAVFAVAQRHEMFWADHVWWELEGRGIEGPREPSALGPVMRMGKSMGWIESTKMTKESERPCAHGKPNRVWKSLVFRGPVSAALVTR